MVQPDHHVQPIEIDGELTIAVSNLQLFLEDPLAQDTLREAIAIAHNVSTSSVVLSVLSGRRLTSDTRQLGENCVIQYKIVVGTGSRAEIQTILRASSLTKDALNSIIQTTFAEKKAMTYRVAVIHKGQVTTKQVHVMPTPMVTETTIPTTTGQRTTEQVPVSPTASVTQIAAATITGNNRHSQRPLSLPTATTTTGGLVQPERTKSFSPLAQSNFITGVVVVGSVAAIGLACGISWIFLRRHYRIRRTGKGISIKEIDKRTLNLVIRNTQLENHLPLRYDEHTEGLGEEFLPLVQSEEKANGVEEKTNGLEHFVTSTLVRTDTLSTYDSLKSQKSQSSSVFMPSRKRADPISHMPVRKPTA